MNISHIFANFFAERLDIMFYYHGNIVFIALIDLRYICIFIQNLIDVSFFLKKCLQETRGIECFKDKMSVSGFG